MELREQVFYCTNHSGYFLRRFVKPDSYTDFSRLAECYHCLSPSNRKGLKKLNPYFEEDVWLINKAETEAKMNKLKDINSMNLTDTRQEMEGLTVGS
jgi:hypothetical protein